jgi:hypothetical protein
MNLSEPNLFMQPERQLRHKQDTSLCMSPLPIQEMFGGGHGLHWFEHWTSSEATRHGQKQAHHQNCMYMLQYRKKVYVKL